MGWIAQQFELSRGGDHQNVLPMEGLRGFAVFLVFLVHYATLIGPWVSADSRLADVSAAIHTIGNAGVDLFFVLSGYLIYGSLIRRRTDFLPYMRKRVARIYPAFLVVFAIYLALSFLAPAQSKIPPGAPDAWLYVVENLLLLPGLFPIEPLITVAWSLSYEMFYYIAIPATILALALRERSRRWRVTFFLIVATALTVYCAANGGHVRLIMFIAGILLFETLAERALPAPRSASAVMILLAGLAATLMPFAGSAAFAARTVILAVTFFILCYCCFRERGNALAQAFSWTPLRWLGNMSYSYYLLHGLALKVGFMAMAKFMPSVSGESLFFLGMLAPMFLLTLVPTVILFICIERPLSLAPKARSPIAAGQAVAD